MRFAIALAVATFPVTAAAQSAGDQLRACVEERAIRYAMVSGSIGDAADTALAACADEIAKWQLAMKLTSSDMDPVVRGLLKQMRDHLLVVVAEERLKH